MENTIPSTYPDPTKPVVPPFHKRKSVGWVAFIGFNILFPILFLITYLWMQTS